jgi:hypothetical protein
MAKHYDILPDNNFQHYKGGVDDRTGLVEKLGALTVLFHHVVPFFTKISL